MIEIRHTDIFRDDAAALVNPVNCFGVMGAGLARAFRDRFPANYTAYRRFCNQRRLAPGKLFIHSERERIIVNLPTKKHFRDPSRLTYIRDGMTALAAAVGERGIDSIAIPALGCGLGDLRWRAVRPIIEDAMAELPEVSVRLYPPQGPRRSDRPRPERAIDDAVKRMKQGRMP